MKRLMFLMFAVVCFGTMVCSAQNTNETEMAGTLEKKSQQFKAHIQDKESGEALPFVTIFVKSGTGTMTNEDGDFSIIATPDDELQISYVGYETVKIKAKDLPRKVVMKSLSLTIDNVTVISTLNILKKVEKRLDKEYKKNRKYSSKYFMRQVTSTKFKEMLEAFVEANNAGNLRDITFLSGRHGRQTGKALQRSLVADMNFHHPLELGMKINGSEYWKYLITPFRFPSTYSVNANGWTVTKKELSKYYDYSHEELYDENKHMYYRINFENNHKTDRAMLVGSLYIDAETYEVLNFEGAVEGLSVNVIKDFMRKESPIELKLNIKYRSLRGFTEVDNINYTMTCAGLTNKALLVNIDEIEYDKKGRAINIKRNATKNKKGKDQNENMLAELSAEGFDKAMEEHADYVQRTVEESDLAMGKMIYVDDQLTNRYCVGGKDSTNVWKLQLPDTPMGNSVNRLAKIGQVIPQEKVYVQMDNTCYFLGDTIWYSAYLRRTSDDLPSTISGILYVELYNQDGYLIQRQMIDMKDGRGHGNFVTTDDMYGGYYELRAYTRWQLNWGAYVREHSDESEKWFINEEMENRYFRDYEKLYSRVFPVYDAPKQKGKYNEIMTTRTLRRYFRKDPDKRELELRLYPEGGEMIAGVPCRVAFEAVYNDGEYASGTLSTGKTVLAKTENRGRGVFTFTPTDKSSQEFVFTSDFDKSKAKAKIKDIEDNGVALSVVRNDSLWNIHVQKVGAEMPDSIGLTVMHDGRVRVYEEIYVSDSIFTIPDSILEAGVNQVTVFDKDGRVFADRLFFVTRQGLGNDNLIINGMKEQYDPYEKIRLGIHSASTNGKKENGILSVSVRDMEHADYLHDSGTMMTEMLLSSEVKGFIPNPGYFFEKDDAEHRLALDLMMMTQGWRRFKWRDMAVRGAWELTQPDERTPIIIGSIYKYPPHYFYETEEWLSYVDLLLPEVNDDAAESKRAEHTINNMGDKVQEDTEPGVFTDVHEHNAFLDKPRGVGNAKMKSASVILDTYDVIDEDGTRYIRDNVTFTDYTKVPPEYQVQNTTIKPTVVVNSEFVDAETNTTSRVTIGHDNGRFRLTLPKFYNKSVFHLAAADTADFKKRETVDNHTWITSMPSLYTQSRKHRSEYPKFSVRVDFPYPRFVNKYDFYQQRIDLSKNSSLGEKKLSDGSYQLAEVKVGAKHGGLRSHNDSLPALVVDGYEAYNYALDAGMRHATPLDILRAYVGDYGIRQPYYIELKEDGMGEMKIIRAVKRYDLSKRNGATTIDRMFSDNTLNEDSMYLRRNLESHSRVNLLHSESYGERLIHIDKYALYTDYQPRLYGSSRYSTSNLPKSEIAIYPILDAGERRMYRDRCWTFDGIALPDEFYSPDYSKMSLSAPPADYRRTLYWNPELQLDTNGSAVIEFYNNSSMNQISIKAEGFTSNGILLEGQK